MIDHDEIRKRTAEWIRQNFPGVSHTRMLRETFGMSRATAVRVMSGKAGRPLIDLMAQTRWADTTFGAFVFQRYLSPPAMHMPKYLWATDSAIIEAVGGHDEAARIHLGRSPARVNFAEVARRNLGWVSVTLEPRHATLTFHKAADPAALKRARDWLAERATDLSHVTLNGVRHDAAPALLELDRLVVQGATQDAQFYGWHIERKSLDLIHAPDLQNFMRARAQVGDAAGTLPALVTRTNVINFAALYHRKKSGETRTLLTGPELGIDPAAAIGKTLAERAERDGARYVGLLGARLDAARIEPTLHSLKLETNGYWWTYESLATADRPAADGSQILGVVVNIKEKVAA